MAVPSVGICHKIETHTEKGMQRSKVTQAHSHKQGSRGTQK